MSRPLLVLGAVAVAVALAAGSAGALAYSARRKGTPAEKPEGETTGKDKPATEAAAAVAAAAPVAGAVAPSSSHADVPAAAELVSSSAPSSSESSPPSSSSSPASDWSHRQLAPLASFFPLCGLGLPDLRVVPPEDLPPVYRHLLEHARNMTPTLHTFWRDQPVGLRVVRKDERRAEGQLRRWIVLEVARGEHVELDREGTPVPPTSASTTPSTPSLTDATSPAAVAPPTPVEFGSIRIHVDNLPSSLHPAVWAGVTPFHTLLAQHAPPIVQTVSISLYFRLAWSDALRRALDIDPSVVDPEARYAYGRCNTMRDTQQRVICEVVEVMPPMRR